MAARVGSEALLRLFEKSGSAVSPGRLHLIATPIGNLGDLTLRAARTLAEMDVLYCEDTRVTAKLLHTLGLRCTMISLNEHNETERTAGLIARLGEAKAVGLVSDAGMPLLSDPGARLLRSVLAAGFEVTVIPGASAALTALVGSGLATAPSVFLGFAARKKGRLAEQVAPFAQTGATLVFFETPSRLSSLFTALLALLGDRPLVIGRELTKLHESFHRGSLAAPPEVVLRGEAVVVIGPGDENAESLVGAALDTAVNELVAAGHRPKQVALLLAGRADRREAYAAAVKLRDGR